MSAGDMQAKAMSQAAALALPPWPVYAEDEQEAVQRVLQSGQGNYWFGEQGKLFEQEFAAWCGAGHGLALANGTVALELALRALGIGAGDEVITTPRSFIATANSIALCGARAVFADVDVDSQNITPDSVAQQINERTRAILVVHLAGWPCDMAGFKALAGQHRLQLIEDCAQAHGASIGQKKVGSFADVAAFSFCHDKILSTGGEGGMLLTGDAALWARAAAFRNHGRDPGYTAAEGDGQSRFFHESIGSNYRLTEMQSAIGRVQLPKLEGWLQQRRRNAAILTAALDGLEAVRIPSAPAALRHAYYRFYFFVNNEQLRKGWSRERILHVLQAKGLPCTAGICPEIYLEPAYKNRRAESCPRLPNAMALGASAITLPVHPGIGEQTMQDLAALVRGVLQAAA